MKRRERFSFKMIPGDELHDLALSVYHTLFSHQNITDWRLQSADLNKFSSTTLNTTSNKLITFYPNPFNPHLHSFIAVLKTIALSVCRLDLLGGKHLGFQAHNMIRAGWGITHERIGTLMFELLQVSGTTEGCWDLKFKIHFAYFCHNEALICVKLRELSLF